MTEQKPRQFSRSFVPAAADMGDWAQLEPLFAQLEARAIDTPETLEQWLLDSSELASCLSEEGSRRYVAMTCKTDDEARKRAHLFFVENIEPKAKVRWNTLRQRYVASPARTGLPRDRYRVYDRSVTNEVELFREANVPLQTEDARLDQQYQEVCGAMTVQFDGREQTLQQMGRYLHEPDRALRQQAWQLLWQRRLADRDRINDIFDAMIRVRRQMATNAGFDSFRDYQFRAYERFDYGPADCVAFHRSIETLIVPLVRELGRKRQAALAVDTLRPWDLAVDTRNRPPLKPFATSDELCAKCARAFGRLDPELGRQFQTMVDHQWLDLESRKGKAPGGYQTTFEEQRHPFIFMNAVGLHDDVETLLHEGGHAFHTLACRAEPLVAYRHCGMEMAEVASMGMELLCYDFFDEFYSGEELQRARREKLDDVIRIFPWVATIDAFQHWLYLNPEHTRDQRTAEWLSLWARFGGAEDWTGFEPVRACRWQAQLHLFGVPFYYVEYGIAQIGALQLWRNARSDRAGALRKYREALALGGSRPLPELWRAAGLTFDFSEKTLAPLIDLVRSELDKLPE